VRVALVSPYSLSVPGGVQGQVLALARALRRVGHEAVVMGPADGPVPDTGLPSSAVVELGRSLPVPANGSIARLSVGPLTQARVLRAIERLHPDVVHLHEPLAPGPTWASLARPEPKVGTFHRSGAVTGRSLLAPAARFLTRRLAARTAVSEEARTTAEALAGGDYEIIGNGVELDRFTTARPWPTSGPTVLFVGRHERRKGLDALLEAFAGLDTAFDATLWIAGEGRDTAELRRRFTHVRNLEWLGRIDDDELAARLVGAHVLCAPSRGGESFGIVLVETMAARTLVVASDIPGYAAVVDGHGLLVPPGDVPALREALSRALADTAAGRGPGAPAALAAAASYAEQWSMDVIAARYLAVYEHVRAGQAGR
jgi:phosphatidylinositol alpha-mannosyltransferase